MLCVFNHGSRRHQKRDMLAQSPGAVEDSEVVDVAKSSVLQELKNLMRNKVVGFSKGILAREERSSVGFVSKLKNMIASNSGVRPRGGSVMMSDRTKSHDWFDFASVTIAGVEVCLGVDRRTRKLYGYLRFWPEVEFSVRNESFTVDYRRQAGDEGYTDHIGFFRGSQFHISEDPENVNIVSNYGDVYRISKKYFLLDTVLTEYNSSGRLDSLEKLHETIIEDARDHDSAELAIYVSCKRADFRNLSDWVFIDVPPAVYGPPTFQPFRGNLSIAPVNDFGNTGEIKHTQELSNYRSGIVSLVPGFATRNGSISGFCGPIYQESIAVSDNQILVYYDSSGEKSVTTIDADFDHTDADARYDAYIIYGRDEEWLFFPGADVDLYLSDDYHESLIGLSCKNTDHRAFISIDCDREPTTLEAFGSGTIGIAYPIKKAQLDIGGIDFGNEYDAPGDSSWVYSEANSITVTVPINIDDSGNKRIVGRMGILLSGIPSESRRYRHETMDTWVQESSSITRANIATLISENIFDIDCISGQMMIRDRGELDIVDLYLDKDIADDFDNIDSGRFAVVQEERILGVSQRTLKSGATGVLKSYNPFCALADT